ncbi:MAG: hypothetical protein M1828_001577 [Chrysothrix sp. TS-e1954]|nr:MAG: hypothetical protein M1828_001577 [Chrysothrix sp. TS-e1954]
MIIGSGYAIKKGIEKYKQHKAGKELHHAATPESPSPEPSSQISQIDGPPPSYTPSAVETPRPNKEIPRRKPSPMQGLSGLSSPPRDVNSHRGEAHPHISDPVNENNTHTEQSSKPRWVTPTNPERIPYPVTLPQRRSMSAECKFAKAYAPVLAGKGINQAAFLWFLEAHEHAIKASPECCILNIAAGGLGIDATLIALLADGTENALIHSNIEPPSDMNRFLDRMNDQLFKPRGLLCILTECKPHSSGILSVGDVTEYAGARSEHSPTQSSMNVVDGADLVFETLGPFQEEYYQHNGLAQGATRLTMHENALYLMVVNLPSQSEVDAVKAQPPSKPPPALLQTQALPTRERAPEPPRPSVPTIDVQSGTPRQSVQEVSPHNIEDEDEDPLASPPSYTPPADYAPTRKQPTTSPPPVPSAHPPPIPQYATQATPPPSSRAPPPPPPSAAPPSAASVGADYTRTTGSPSPTAAMTTTLPAKHTALAVEGAGQDRRPSATEIADTFAPGAGGNPFDIRGFQ